MGVLQSIFRGGTDEDRVALSLDIGTEFVKALIFRIDEESETGRVVGIGRARQQLGHMQAGAVTDIAGVVATCEKAIQQAAEQAGFVPQQVILGIAGELVKGTTTSVNYERKKPNSKIDMPELKNIIHKIQWKAFDDARAQLAWETGHKEIDVKLINAAIVDVQIDGYQVTNPIGFQGRDVSIGIFNAYAPLIHLGALQSIIEELDLELLSIAAEPYAVARCMGHEESTDFDAIFIDIGGGTTDIAVVRKGGVEGTKMFALGGRAFTKRISEQLGLNFHQAEEVKLEFARGKLSKESSTQVASTIQDDIGVWLSGVELALSEFQDIDLMPSRILLCGGGSALPGIEEALMSKEWVKNLPFAKQPRVKFITPKDIQSIQDTTGMLRHPQDITPMGLANLALDVALDDQPLSGILRRTVRMIQS